MMSILGGQFAMMLVVATDARSESLEKALNGALRLSAVSVNEVEGYGEHGARENTHEIMVDTVEDRRGVMNVVSVALADLKINIVGLSSAVSRVPPDTTCAMFFAVALPDGVTENDVHETLERALDEAAIPRARRTVRVAARHEAH